MRAILNLATLGLLAVAATDVLAAEPARTDEDTCSFICTEDCPTPATHEALCVALYSGCHAYLACPNWPNTFCQSGQAESSCWPGV